MNSQQELQNQQPSDQRLVKLKTPSKVILVSSTSTPPIISPQTRPLKDLVVVDSEEEQKFALAVFDNPAISKMDSAQANVKLAGVIGVWAYMLGLPKEQVPNEADLDIINPWIKNTFGQLSVAEIKNAIHYSIEGKFDINVNTYNSTISPRYISMVLQAYLTYRTTKIRKINEQTEKYIYANAVATESTPELEMQLMKEMIINAYDYFVKHGTVLDMKNYIWDYLKRTNKLQATPAAKQLAMAEGLKRMEEIMKAGRRPSNLQTISEVMKRDLEEQNRKNFEDGQKLYAREYLLKYFFASRSLNAILDTIKIEEFQNLQNNGA